MPPAPPAPPGLPDSPVFRVRRLPGATLLAFLEVQIAFSLLANWWIGRRRRNAGAADVDGPAGAAAEGFGAALDPVPFAWGSPWELLDPNLLPAGLLLLGVVGGLFVARGGLRAADLGFGPGARLLRGLGFGALVYLAASGLEVLLGAGSARLASPFSDNPFVSSVYAGLGLLLGELLGNSLYEEIAFRAVLWPQLALRLRGPGWWRATAALIVSQAIFALVHLPARLLLSGTRWGDLPLNLLITFASGVAFALVYAATANLIAAVATHAVFNAYVPLAPFSTGATWWAPLAATGAVLFVVAFRRAARRAAASDAPYRPDRPDGSGGRAGAAREGSGARGRREARGRERGSSRSGRR